MEAAAATVEAAARETAATVEARAAELSAGARPETRGERSYLNPMENISNHFAPDPLAVALARRDAA